jgi:RecB family endonuclease NucS
MASITSEQRTALLNLRRQGVEDVHELEKRTGIPWRTISAIKANVTMGRVVIPEQTESEEALDAIETKFGLEKDLQKELRKRIADLEPELAIADGGKERSVPSGFIDITAQDRHGSAVVIELKAGAADRDAIGQILAYMGDLMATEKTVRGIVVAGEFTPRAIAAARAAGNIQLRQYHITFSFPSVSLAPAAA